MDVACIDIEGVLIPELWPLIAQATGIDEFNVTTREEPDYERLVESRIRTLRHNSLRLSDIQALICRVAPLAGAVEFLTHLRRQFQVVLVSDAFEDMLTPLWQRLGEPQLRCHRFICDADGYVCAARYSRANGKHEVIEEFSALGHRTLAVGDAFNDLMMLRCASMGYLFRPSPQTMLAGQGLPVVTEYSEILDAIR